MLLSGARARRPFSVTDFGVCAPIRGRGWVIYHLRCVLFGRKKKEIITTLSSNFRGVHPTRDEMSRREQMVFVVSQTPRPPFLYIYIHICVCVCIILPCYIYTPRHYLSYSPLVPLLPHRVLYAALCTLSTPYFCRIFFFVQTTINHPPRCNYYCHEIIILHLYMYILYIYIIIL